MMMIMMSFRVYTGYSCNMTSQRLQKFVYYKKFMFINIFRVGTISSLKIPGFWNKSVRKKKRKIEEWRWYMKPGPINA